MHSEKILDFLPQTLVQTLAVMAHRLQQQVNEYSQLFSLATCQETQNNGGPGGGTCFPLKLAACFTAQATKQDPVEERANTGLRGQIKGLVTSGKAVVHY